MKFYNGFYQFNLNDQLFCWFLQLIIIQSSLILRQPLAQTFLILAGLTQLSNQAIFYQTFHSKTTSKGEFSSPNWPNSYPQNIRNMFIFIGQKNEQITIHFKHFNIEGLSAICKKDFMDVYTEIKQLNKITPADLTRQLMAEQGMGRFCGHNLEYIPTTLVSRYHILVLDFFSASNTQASYNQDNHMGNLGFLGNFTFTVNEMMSVYQTPHAKYNCFYFIHRNRSLRGTIVSPNYPGPSNYPMHCVYEFQSDVKTDRIHLRFLNFQLFQYESSCPVEYVKIVDGDLLPSKRRNVITRRVCGQKAPFDLFSISNHIFVIFVVSASRDFLKEPHNMNIYKKSLQSKGFRLEYEFSSQFVKLNVPVIPGTECDLLVRNDGKLSSTIQSPIIPNNALDNRAVTCNFYFMGKHNSQIMEVAHLNFTKLNLPYPSTDRNNKCSLLPISISSAKFKILNIVKRQRKILKDSKHQNKLCELVKDKNNDNNEQFIFRGKSPVTILQLTLTKNAAISADSFGDIFELNYRFLKDYGIEGKMISEGRCHFSYRSHETGKSGLINSPFYNNFYPNNANCQYDLIAEQHEMIRIVFIDFQTSEDVSPGLTNYHDVHLACRQDYLSISEIVRKDGHYVINVTERYCGASLPGLLVSQTKSIGFTLKFQSDGKKSGPGFLARYQFLQKQKLFTDCGRNISLHERTGIISSPRFPKRYPSNLICEWHMYSPEPKDKVILHFTDFQIEGTSKSCSNAVLRIYEGSNVRAESELCGTDSAIPAYVSLSNFIRIRFLTDQSSRGANGFRIIWTRMIPLLKNGTCPQFLCIYSSHCIHRNLTCNGQHNCGSFISESGSVKIDRSDEENACPKKPDVRYLYSGLGIVAIILLLLIAVILFFLNKNKHLMKQKMKIKVSSNNINNGTTCGGNVNGTDDGSNSPDEVVANVTGGETGSHCISINSTNHHIFLPPHLHHTTHSMPSPPPLLGSSSSSSSNKMAAVTGTATVTASSSTVDLVPPPLYCNRVLQSPNFNINCSRYKKQQQQQHQLNSVVAAAAAASWLDNQYFPPSISPHIQFCSPILSQHQTVHLHNSAVTPLYSNSAAIDATYYTSDHLKNTAISSTAERPLLADYKGRNIIPIIWNNNNNDSNNNNNNDNNNIITNNNINTINSNIQPRQYSMLTLDDNIRPQIRSVDPFDILDDNLECLSDNTGFLTREKMQKISMV